MENQIRIVVLQRGWVAVGRYSQSGDDCVLENASIVRYWGTTKGLGEIAEGGPTGTTKLDACPPLRFHQLTVLFTMDCNQAKWAAACS